MFLSQIIADPAKYQKRGKPFSESTVAGIVAEGIDLAKFDPIPLLPLGDGRYCVGGDGHSRFEAVTRLAAAGSLPDAWSIADGEDWDIPHRLIDADAARKLARSANLSRDAFTPSEEAAIYAEMVGEGMTVELIGREVHKSPETVRRTLALNTLCGVIREQIGRPTNAGGITKDAAIELAQQFEQNGVGGKLQQDLWVSLLAKMDLTPAAVRSLRGVFAKVGGAARQRETQDVLFSLPPNVDLIIDEAKRRAAKLSRAERALSALLNLADGDTLDGLDGLKGTLTAFGSAWLNQIKYEQDEDGAAIGSLVGVS